MDYKYLVETNIFAQEVLSGIKPRTLIESITKIELVHSETEGKKFYSMDYRVEADLSGMVDEYATEYVRSERARVNRDMEEIIDDVMDNFYEKKDLDRELWDAVRHIRGVDGLDFDVSMRTKLDNVASIEDLKNKLTNTVFDVTVKVFMDFDSEIKTDIDLAIEKALSKNLK